MQTRGSNECIQRKGTALRTGRSYTHLMAPLYPSSPRGHRQPVRSCIGTLTLRRKHWIELDGRFVIGDGGAELLRAVDHQGSLAQAARHVGWSYRHAWGYGGIYIAASLVWLWLIERQAPTRTDMIGAALAIAGALIIIGFAARVR